MSASLNDRPNKVEVSGDAATVTAGAGVQGAQGDPGIIISATQPTETDVLWADTSATGSMVVPAGGTTGQALVKSSGSDYDTSWSTITSGAPVGAQYVTLATDGTLTSERVLTAGTGITVTDAGAGSTVTVATSAILPTIIDAKGDLIVGTAADTAARLAVGTDGHVLTAASVQSGGVKWQQPFSTLLSQASGRFIAPNTGSGSGLTSGLTIDVTYVNFGRLYVDQSVTVNQILCEIKNTGTNRKAKMGVWTESNGLPATVVIDSGEFDTSTTGVKTVTLGASVTLQPGFYWVGFYPNAATSLECANTAFASPLGFLQNSARVSLEANNNSSYPAGALPNNPSSGAFALGVKVPWIRLAVV